VKKSSENNSVMKPEPAEVGSSH